MRLAIPFACLLAMPVALSADVTALPDTPGFKLWTPGGMPADDAGSTLAAIPDFTASAGGIQLHFNTPDQSKPGVTALRTLTAILGGHVQHYHTGKDDQLEWLCYTQAATATAPIAVVWIRASAMGAETVENLVAEIAPSAEVADCSAPSRPLSLTLSLPGLGAKLADVKKALGPADLKDGKLIYKKHQSFQDLGLDFVLVYKIDDGVVTAFSLDQAGTG